ncbi:uncharacterized protein LOC144708400 [Wolffia australiana]
MAKSLRSKMQRRLRTLRRDLAQPFYDKKDAAKIAAQEAALEAPKLPVPQYKKPAQDEGDEIGSEITTTQVSGNAMDVEMTEGVVPKKSSFLKARGGIGKNSRKKQKGKRGKGKYKKKYDF